LTADPAIWIQQTSSFDDFLFCMCFEMKPKDSLEQRQTSWEAGNLRHPSYLDATLIKSLQEFGSFDRLNVLATAPMSSVEEDIKRKIENLPCRTRGLGAGLRLFSRHWIHRKAAKK
jgi:hypothetical protein